MIDTGSLVGSLWNLIISRLIHLSSHTKSREYQRMRQGRPVGVMHPSWTDQCRVFASSYDCNFI